VGLKLKMRKNSSIKLSSPETATEIAVIINTTVLQQQQQQQQQQQYFDTNLLNFSSRHFCCMMYRLVTIGLHFVTYRRTLYYKPVGDWFAR